MASVICLGWACLDHRYWVETFPPASGRTRTKDFREDLGGPAAVAAMTVARLGGQATFVGRRGNDATGERLAERLRSEGVNVDYYKPFEDVQTPLSAVMIAPSAERFIFSYLGNGLPEDADWLDASILSDEESVLLFDLRWPQGALFLAKAASEKHLDIVLDMDQDTEFAWELASKATHVITDEGLSQTYGGSKPLLNKLAATHTWGAVTKGTQGVKTLDTHIPAFKVEPKDTTGAGDVFHGAFALALAEGMTEEDGLRFASAASALRVRKADVPYREDVEKFMENF